MTLRATRRLLPSSFGRFPMIPGVATPRRRRAPRSKSRRSSGRRVRRLLLALAGAGYGVEYTLVGRFYVSTDDAYVRANNTMLGARVSGHIAAILSNDNTVVRKGEVVFRIDDGTYKIAVDAVRTRIATQEATIARIGRQVAAQVSAVEQSQANLAAAEAGLKRAGLHFDRPQT